MRSSWTTWWNIIREGFKKGGNMVFYHTPLGHPQYLCSEESFHLLPAANQRVQHTAQECWRWSNCVLRYEIRYGMPHMLKLIATHDMSNVFLTSKGSLRPTRPFVHFPAFVMFCGVNVQRCFVTCHGLVSLSELNLINQGKFRFGFRSPVINRNRGLITIHFYSLAWVQLQVPRAPLSSSFPNFPGCQSPLPHRSWCSWSRKAFFGSYGCLSAF